MVTGATGCNGQLAQFHVRREEKQDQETVMIHHQPMEEHLARVNRMRLNHAQREPSVHKMGAGGGLSGQSVDHPAMMITQGTEEETEFVTIHHLNKVVRTVQEMLRWLTIRSVSWTCVMEDV